MGPGRKHAALPPRWVTANSHRRRRRWRHPPEETRLGWGPPRRGVGAWPAHCAHRPTAAGGWPLSLRGRARRAGERERARCPFVLQPLLNKPLTFTGCSALMSLSVLMSVRSSKDNAPQPSACIRVTGGPLVRYDGVNVLSTGAQQQTSCTKHVGSQRGKRQQTIATERRRQREWDSSSRGHSRTPLLLPHTSQRHGSTTHELELLPAGNPTANASLLSSNSKLLAAASASPASEPASSSTSNGSSRLSAIAMMAPMQ